MANWQRTLTLVPHWDQAEKGEITLQNLAGVIATQLRALTPFGEDQFADADYLNSAREDLCEQFEDISEDASATQEMFNDYMEDLYNWADTSLDGTFPNIKRCCWIART